MGEVDYTKRLPKKPPEEIVPWLQEKGMLEEELLTYRVDSYVDPLTEQRVKCVRVTCSACLESMLVDYVPSDCCHSSYAPAPFGFWDPTFNQAVMSGNDILCPLCGEAVVATHIGSLRSPRCFDAYPMTVERVGDKLALCGWCVRKVIDKDAETHYEIWPYEAYVVEEKKIIRLTGYSKCMSSIRRFGHWEERKRYADIWGRADLVFPWDARLLQGTTAKNSKLDVYMAAGDIVRPVTYLKIWTKHHNIENLIVQGAGDLIKEMINNACERGYYEPPKVAPTLPQINWKEKRPAQMLGLTKEEFRVFKIQGWASLDLSFYKECRDRGIQLKLPEDMATVIKLGSIDALTILNREPNTPPMKALRYLEKQKRWEEKGTGEGTSRILRASDLIDYWRMAAGLGSNVEAESVKWPKDLAAAHDRVMAEEKRCRELEEHNKLKKMMAARKEKFAGRQKELSAYNWEFEGLIIRVCEIEQELINEGDALNHCVSRYAESHAKGKTAIFFIRRKEAPQVPFYTLELNEKQLTVKQNRGAHNCERTDEIKKFELAWLEWLQEQRGKKTKKRKKKEVQVA